MTFTPGLVLNERYEIRAPLPEPQGASCYRALDLKLGRDVRVRCFPLPPPSEALRHFDQRTLALATLVHPHIRIFQDVGTLRREGYTVCAWQEGRTLAELGRLPWAALRTWIDEALKVLRVAHARGIAHGRLDATCLLEVSSLGILVQDFALCPEDGSRSALPLDEDLRALGRIMANALEGPPTEAFQALLKSLSEGRFPPPPASGAAQPRARALRLRLLAGGLAVALLGGGLAWRHWRTRPIPLDAKALQARRLFLEGRHHWNRRNKDNLLKAEALLRQAIALDPSYAEAYVTLAECQALGPPHGGTRSEDAVREARETLRALAKVDPANREGLLVEAYILFRYEYRWREAEALFRKGLEPGAPTEADPTRLHWFGFFLSCLGRHEEAVIWLKRAVAVDPLNLQARTNLAVALSWAGRQQEAFAEMHEILELDPAFRSASDRLIGLHETDGDLARALEVMEDQVHLGVGRPKEAQRLRAAWNARGRRGYFETQLEIFRELRMQTGEPFFEALPLTALGRKDEAFEALDRALAFHSPFMVWVYQDPRLAPLRPDPRFQALLRRLNLP